MGGLFLEERFLVGKLVNEIKVIVEEKLDSVIKKIKDKEKVEKFVGEIIDILFLGRKKVIGKRYLLDLIL